jgi:hypothetical protein
MRQIDIDKSGSGPVKNYNGAVCYYGFVIGVSFSIVKVNQSIYRISIGRIKTDRICC